MTQHTPGPWARNGNLIEGPDGETVAYVTAYNTMTPQQKANVRLIAAAPELLAALENVMANPTTFSFEPIRAAIAKATGEEK